MKQLSSYLLCTIATSIRHGIIGQSQCNKVKNIYIKIGKGENKTLYFQMT